MGDMFLSQMSDWRMAGKLLTPTISALMCQINSDNKGFKHTPENTPLISTVIFFIDR